MFTGHAGASAREQPDFQGTLTMLKHLVACGVIALCGVAAGAPEEWGKPVLAAGDPVPTTAEAALEKALKVGDRVPGVSFRDAAGEEVSLASLLEGGPVVLVFYRGGWCPYCVNQLKELEAHRAAIESAGGRVVAVSTELPEFTGQTREKAKLGFPVFSDAGAGAARAFGVAWANGRYAKPLAKYQGNEKGEIPLGVTYVIDGGGVVRWAFLESDYKERATSAQIVEALGALD